MRSEDAYARTCPGRRENCHVGVSGMQYQYTGAWGQGGFSRADDDDETT